jgi:hypothetical protein
MLALMPDFGSQPLLDEIRSSVKLDSKANFPDYNS